MAVSNEDKENPNPIIHSTSKRTSLESRKSDVSFLGSQSIRRYGLGANFPNRHELRSDYSIDIESTSTGVPTAEERLVAIALSEAAHSNSTNKMIGPSIDNASPYVELLHNAGFPILKPNQLQKALKIPSFIPSGMSKLTHNPSPKRNPITSEEVFEIIRNIQDPEHPLTLEQLNVVRLELVQVVDKHPDLTESENDAIPTAENDSEGRVRESKFSTVSIQFTPTIPHCSMATLIGLTIRVKLLRSLPARFKVTVKIESGTHVSEHAVNKQLADKERVRAALENEHLLGVVNKCIAGTG